METVTFVEVLDRRGRTTERASVTRLPFRIGRGYDCDLILDDPHVEGLHAVIERNTEGELVLRDAESSNGVVAEDERGAGRVHVIDDELRVRVGRTQLRLRAPHYEIAAAIPIHERSRFGEWWREHWSAALVVPIVWLAITAYGSFRATTSEFDWIEHGTLAAWGLLAFGTWVGVWALLNRLLRHRTRFVAHSTVAFAIASISTMSDWLFEWLRFFVEAIGPLEIAALAVASATGAALGYAHLSILAVGSRRLRWMIITFGGTLLFSLQVIERENGGENWASTLPYWSRLLPVDPDWLPLETPETYFAGAAELADELDELAREAQEADAEDEG